MTTAVCVSCGSVKGGAWTECDDCGLPASIGGQLSLVLTDHYFSAESLQDLARLVKHITAQAPTRDLKYLCLGLALADYVPSLVEPTMSALSRWRARRVLRRMHLPDLKLVFTTGGDVAGGTRLRSP